MSFVFHSQQNDMNLRQHFAFVRKMFIVWTNYKIRVKFKLFCFLQRTLCCVQYSCAVLTRIQVYKIPLSTRTADCLISPVC